LVVEYLQGIFTHLHETQLIALGLGRLTILIIVVLRKSRPALPGTLFAMLTVGGLVAAFDLNSHGMHRVNNFDARGVQLLELIAEELRSRGGGLYFSGVNTRVFQVFKN